MQPTNNAIKRALRTFEYMKARLDMTHLAVPLYPQDIEDIETAIALCKKALESQSEKE